MTDTTVAAAALSTAPATAARAAPVRPPFNDDDLYAEGVPLGTMDETETDLRDLFGEDGLDFRDLLDIVNPLHHLPIVGTIYRAVTGDSLAPGPRLLGGALFGGIGGFVTALVNAVIENETGSDIGDTALALFRGDDAASAVAARDPAPEAASASVADEKPVVAPSAPSPLAIAGHAVVPRLPLTAAPEPAPAARRSGPDDDPALALIRARAAVPASRHPDTARLPRPADPVAARSVATPTLPIHFKAKTPATPRPPAAEAAPPPATGPRLLEPATARAAASASPAPATPATQVAATTTPDIAALMQSALDKYEALKRTRAAPSIASEI